jgi:hypothetical protein
LSRISEFASDVFVICLILFSHRECLFFFLTIQYTKQMEEYKKK